MVFGGIGKFLFGGEDDSGQVAARESREESIKLLEEGREQARRDARALTPVSEQALETGYGGAYDLMRALMPAQTSAMQQGNLGAQRAVGAGGQQAMNALLGRPVNMSQVTQPIRVGTQFNPADYPTMPSASRALSNTDVLTQIYNDTLGRSPDAIGESYWRDVLNRGAQPQTLIDVFQQSPEYQGINQPVVQQPTGLQDYFIQQGGN